MDVKSRLIRYIETKRLSIRAFERKNGLSNGYVKSIRKSIGTDVLSTILENYPELSRDWLLYGEGKMLRELDAEYGVPINSLLDNRVSDLVLRYGLSKVAEVYGTTKEKLMQYTNRTAFDGSDFKPEKMHDKILSAFPEISREWLLYGEGEMLKSDTSVSKDERGTEDTDEAITLTAENGLIYYYDMVATASDIEDLTDNELNQPYVTLYIPGYEKCVGFNVAGDSMLPTAKHRDIVAIERKKVETIINGEIYFIVTRDGQRMIKRLVQLGKDEEGTMMFRCISDNPNQDLYAPFVISGDRIHTISRVKGFISHLQLG